MMKENPYKKGDRVMIRPGIKKLRSRHGTVYAAPRKWPNLVRVIWNGTRTPATYHIDLIELDTPAETAGAAVSQL